MGTEGGPGGSQGGHRLVRRGAPVTVEGGPGGCREGLCVSGEGVPVGQEGGPGGSGGGPWWVPRGPGVS